MNATDLMNQTSEIYRLTDLGWSQRRVAKKVGCSKSTVKRRLDSRVEDRKHSTPLPTEDMSPSYVSSLLGGIGLTSSEDEQYKEDDGEAAVQRIIADLKSKETETSETSGLAIETDMVRPEVLVGVQTSKEQMLSLLREARDKSLYLSNEQHGIALESAIIVALNICQLVDWDE